MCIGAEYEPAMALKNKEPPCCLRKFYVLTIILFVALLFSAGADSYGAFKNKTDYLPDGVHPCDEGNKKLSECWMELKIKKTRSEKTAFIYGDIFLRHITGQWHPEQPERLTAIREKLEKEGLLQRLYTIQPRAASLKWIAAVHDYDFIEEVERSCREGRRYIHSGDNRISDESFDAAIHAVGGVLQAADAIMEGRVTNAFCAVRPPGHHARAAEAMGFCLFNNVAIAARYLQKYHGLERIAIVDWDVHHGNGTQEAFYDDPSVLYISIHESPLFPGTGSAYERGVGKGKGFNLNFPLEAGSGDSEFLDIFERKIKPAIAEFDPDFMLISAGFDAHRNDPLGNMNVTASGFARMTRILKNAADRHCEGRLISVLEGGYDLEALAESVFSHIRVLSE